METNHRLRNKKTTDGSQSLPFYTILLATDYSVLYESIIFLFGDVMNIKALIIFSLLSINFAHAAKINLKYSVSDINYFDDRSEMVNICQSLLNNLSQRVTLEEGVIFEVSKCNVAPTAGFNPSMKKGKFHATIEIKAYKTEPFHTLKVPVVYKGAETNISISPSI